MTLPDLQERLSIWDVLALNITLDELQETTEAD